MFELIPCEWKQDPYSVFQILISRIRIRPKIFPIRNLGERHILLSSKSWFIIVVKGETCFINEMLNISPNQGMRVHIYLSILSKGSYI